MSEYAVELVNIEKSFFENKVLKGINLQVKPGEVHALMGENGAGKSTLMKILMGIHQANRGKIVVNGEEVKLSNPRDAIKHGISMIHQELNPVLDMEVCENIYLGREPKVTNVGPLSIINKKVMRKSTKSLLEKLGINIKATELMRNLSIAQMQLVEIVKCISLDSKIIIMDEPTSAITEKEVEILFKQIRRLKKEGVAIIYISHKMEEIFQISDTITVLRDGEYIATKAAKELDNNQLIKMMVGREISDVYPKKEVELGEVVLEVDNISREQKVFDASFDLKKGEILGVAGLMGSGRSELMETIFGAYRKTRGTIKINGVEVNIKTPKDAIKNKIAFITEDRKVTGLNLSGTIKENISIAGIEKVSNMGIINSIKDVQAAKKYVEALKIKVFSINDLVSSLSGGNQQKVVIGKWLLSEPDIIILDEPTRGIDVGAKRDIYLLMGELASKGKSIIMISSEMPEVMGISDRIIVMAHGKISGELNKGEFTQELIMKYASDLGGNNEK